MGKNNWQGIFGHMVQYLLTLQQYGKMVTTTVMKLPECTTNGSRMICSLNLSSLHRHVRPHIDVSLLCWQRAVALLRRSCRCFSNLVIWCLSSWQWAVVLHHRSCRCFSNLVIWCLSSSFVVFQDFFLYHLYSSVQLVLAVCYCPFAEHARAISVFSLLWWDLSSPVIFTWY